MIQFPHNEQPYFQQIGDLLKQVGQPLPHLVQGVIPDRYLLMLAAKAKHAKTHTVIDIMDSVVTGKPVFGRYTVNRPGPVIYYAMEDGEYEFNSRFRQRGMQEGDLREIYIRTEPVDLSTPEGVEEMARRVVPLQPVLIVIDTAQEALNVQNWNNRTEVATKLRALRHFAHTCCTVILVHHNNKSQGRSSGDEIAGNTSVTASVDGWLSIHRKQVLASGDLRLWVRCEGRGGLKGEIVLQMDTNNLHIRAVDTASIADEDLAREQREKIVELMNRYLPVARAIIQVNGKATVQQIAEFCEQGYKTIQVRVREMRDVGLLEDSGEREGPKRNITLWQLTHRMEAWLQNHPTHVDPDYPSAAAMFANWEESEEDEDDE